MKRKTLIYLLGIVLLAATSSILAQSGGDHDVEWYVTGGAGEQFVSGAAHQVGFTLAQDTPPLVSSGGSHQVLQGYWSGTGYSPTAVTLIGFWVEARAGALVACWETATEVGTLGFHLYRSDTGQPGSFARLNAELIPSHAPGSSEGAAYEWIDASVEMGRTYFYLLEDIDVHGKATRHGPVAATLKPVISDRLYMPLVSR